jgi:hypothetical protein
MSTNKQTPEVAIQARSVQRLLGVLLPDTTVDLVWNPSDESPPQSTSATIISDEFSSATLVDCPELNQELILARTDTDTIELIPRSDSDRSSIGTLRDVEITGLPLEEVPVTESGPKVPVDLVGETGFLDIEYSGHDQQIVIQDGIQEYDTRLSGMFEQELEDIAGVEFVVKMSGCGPRRIQFKPAGDDIQ